MPSIRGRRWTISRRDLAAGGAELVRLSHPLLPHVALARPSEGGLLLVLAAPSPARLEPGPAALRRGFLARLAGLLGFLRFHGLGIGAADVAEIGASPGRPERPSLGTPPVPAWRASPPALVLAGAAVRFAGGSAEADDVIGLRAAAGRALERSLDGDSAEDVVTCLNALDADGRPEALAAEFARRGEAPAGRDLLGLAFPAAWLDVPGDGVPAGASGAAAAWLARGAARRPEHPAFLECGPGRLLEDGSALLELARHLDGDPRAADVHALAAGRRPKSRSPGPPVSVVALEADRWDGRSRRALAEALPEMGFRVFEACTGGFRPWETRPVLGVRIPDGDAASLAYLPFVSLQAGLESWRTETSGAGSDGGRFLRAVNALASRFDVRTGAAGPATVSAARPEPLLAAAALLADGFGSAEAAAAAATTPDEAASALEAAAERGTLVPAGDASFRFRDEGERARLAQKVPVRARREAVLRLEALGLPQERLVPAALARGDAQDLDAALALLEADPSRAGELFARAPRRDPDLGAARAPRPRRLAAASALARAGQPARALALCPGGDLEEDLLRARLLADLRRNAEGARLVTRVLAHAAPVGARVEALLLAAEFDERAHRYEAAAERLAEAEGLLAAIPEPALAARAARTAGYLANDLGRPGEAMALFRRAGELATDTRSRADAAFDVAHAALDGGKLDVAGRELDAALALYAAAGDERRYLSALGNRIDLFLRTGDARAARAVLERVLAHERAPGREHQHLFAIPAAQELALLEGDGSAAAAAFAEARRLCAAVESPHPAWREILVFEAERRLGAGDASGAAEALEEAAAIPDNRARSEPRRVRLLASARLDLGRREGAPALEPAERDLLAAEAALAAGEAPGGGALDALERLASSRDAGLAVRRILEWSGRFPRAFASSPVAPLLRLGRKAAARAGLARAAARFDALLERPAPSRETSPARERGPAPSWLVAEDAASRAVLSEVARVAPSRLPLLVRGESGTGKELVAREAHRLSGRRGPFVALNVAALPATLAEAELFGHARGAFSGADRHRAGLVEESSGGTLFLDEIGDLVLPLQGKLLRVLQEGEVRRLGETAVRRVDLRVVAATHRDLAALVDRGEFRGDLYYRLAGHEVVLPPFRDRPRDRARLVERVLDGRAVLDREAAAAVDRYAWPGNAREIVSALERAVVLAAPEPTIRLEHLPHALREVRPRAPLDYRTAVDDARRRAIDAALEATHGRRAEAAKLLGISRQSLLYEMKKLGSS